MASITARTTAGRKSPFAPHTLAVSDLLRVSASDASRLWPVLGSAAAMAALYGLRRATAGDANLLGWGAYNADKVLHGEWWRLFSQAFVYADGLQLAGDLLALGLFSPALAKLQSPTVAFSAFRLGLLVSAGVLALGAPRDAVVSSVSGSAYAVAGALLVALATNTRGWSALTARDTWAIAALAVAAATLVARSLTGEQLASQAQMWAVGAGVGGATLARIVAAVERRFGKQASGGEQAH